MIIITKPTIEDIKQIQEVFYITWLATYPNEAAGVTVDDVKEKYKDRYSEQAINKRIKGILDIPEGKLFLIAKEEGAVVGVCRLKKEKTHNELEAIYVLPDHQRKGIGKMLWNRAMEFFGSEKDIIVRVAAYNEKAIKFYKRIGFVETGKRFTDEKHKMPISGSIIPEMELVIKR